MNAQQVEQLRREKMAQRERPIVAASAGKQPETTAELIERVSRKFTGVKSQDAATSSKRITAEAQAKAREKGVACWLESNAPPRQARRMTVEKLGLRGGKWNAVFERLKAMPLDAHVALVGINGNGKTQLGVEMIRSFTSQGKSALWTTATGFLMAVKQCYRDESKTTEEEVVARYSKVDLLVIDEMHRRNGTAWENNLIFEVVDRMYRREKMVFMIANQTREEFSASVGTSITSRINESGGIVVCDWPSFREA